jgi:UDP-N-acetylglucosamine 2-epimerase (non-hydrolysing)/GDP/UDP-N,N'-diacetylbacillosamine 2-epimerase (hydrolysing)
MKTRTIVGVTGSRAEYGLLRPIFAALGADRRVRLRVVVAGMHLSRRHGYSLREIKKDGFAVAHCVRMHSDASTPYHTARALGRGVAGFAKVFRREKPDLVLVLGDRVEALAAVLAAAYMNLPIAHVHGGDRSRGGVDESARHAITKFAHLHFPATKKSEVRVWANLASTRWGLPAWTI